MHRVLNVWHACKNVAHASRTGALLPCAQSGTRAVQPDATHRNLNRLVLVHKDYKLFDSQTQRYKQFKSGI